MLEAAGAVLGSFLAVCDNKIVLGGDCVIVTEQGCCLFNGTVAGMRNIENNTIGCEIVDRKFTY